MKTGTSFREMVFPIVFALVCVVLLIFAWLTLKGPVPLQAKGYRVFVPMHEATALVAGADVQIAGVKVGDVVKARRDGGRALVEIELQPEFSPLHEGATALARTKTLLGEGYLEITAGDPDRPVIEENGRLAAEDVRPRQQLDEVLRTFDPRMRESFRNLVAGLDTAYEGRSQNLSNILGQAAPTLADMEQVLTIADGQRQSLERLFGSSGAVLQALAERQGALQAAIRSGDAVLETTASRDRALAETIRELPPFLAQLETTSRTLADASGDLDAAVAALGPVAPDVVPALQAINAGAPEFEGLFRELPATARAGRAGLPSLRRIAGAARPALAALYPSLRELIPTLRLVSRNRRDINSIFGNVASFLNGTILGPENKQLAFPAATVSLSNELIGGYVKRLPTNILNPYIKPGALGGFAKQGFIDAFDCRNVGNPLLVPPLGETPPCQTQGAWSFGGRSTFYPILKRAKP